MTARHDPLADRIGDVLFPVHRGVFFLRDRGQYVAFGNDCYSNPTTRGRVGTLIAALQAAGLNPREVITSTDAYTWAIVIDTARAGDHPDPARIEDLFGLV